MTRLYCWRSNTSVAKHKVNLELTRKFSLCCTVFFIFEGSWGKKALPVLPITGSCVIQCQPVRQMCPLVRWIVFLIGFEAWSTENNSNLILPVCSRSIAKKVKHCFPAKDFHKFKPIKMSITEEVGIPETLICYLYFSEELNGLGAQTIW